MRTLLLVVALCSACGIETAPPIGCTPPTSFVSCDTSEVDGATRCWATDKSDWLFYPDGRIVHEFRTGQGAEGPILTQVLCTTSGGG